VAHPLLKAFLVRFVSGLAGATALGWLVFRGAVFDPRELAFQCVTVGALTAGVLAAVRVKTHGLALLLVIVFGLGRLGLAGTQGWLLAISGILLATGVYLLALIFDMLAGKGLPFGKFLIMGPLLGGVYLALAPMVEFHTLTSNGVVRALALQLLVGLLIGDGAALGVEVAELPAVVAARLKPAAE
jgi:hypothetical protein